MFYSEAKESKARVTNKLLTQFGPPMFFVWLGCCFKILNLKTIGWSCGVFINEHYLLGPEDISGRNLKVILSPGYSEVGA